MDRRVVVMGLALAPVLPAAAQTVPSVPTPATPSTAGPAPAEVIGLGDAEKSHIRGTMMIGKLALETSKIALEQAQNPKVKQFAQFETAEQETIADVLKAIKAHANDMTVPPPFDEEATATLQKLRLAQGENFDREYVQVQLDGHGKLLEVQQKYLAVGKHLDSENVAKLARGMVKEHLALLQDLQGTRG